MKVTDEDQERLDAISGGHAKLPPEDWYCQDLNAISIVGAPGKGKHQGRKGLDQGAKRLLARVMAFARTGGCYASNETLAVWLGASRPSITRWVAQARDFGILDVKTFNGHRLLSMNQARLAELKKSYLKALKARNRRKEYSPNHEKTPNQLDEGGCINLMRGANQLEETPNQLDDQLNKCIKEANRKEDDDGAPADARAPTAASSISFRDLGTEESLMEQVEEARRSLESIEEKLSLKGLAYIDCLECPEWLAASRRYEALTEQHMDLDMRILDLHLESEEEDKRIALEAEQAERQKCEAELDSWKSDLDHRILVDPAMVLDAFQSACRRRFAGETLSFPPLEGQVQQASSILELLKKHNRLDEIVLREWIIWHVQSCLNGESPAYHITIRFLEGSWGKFIRQFNPRSLSKAEQREHVLYLRQKTSPDAIHERE